MKYLTEVIYW